MEEEDWEWDILSPILLSHLANLRENVIKALQSPSKFKLIVPNCRDTKLCFRLYDEGNNYITALLQSPVDLMKILDTCKNQGRQQTIKWTCNDITQLAEDGTYSAIIDKHTFRALSNDVDVESYLNKVSSLLLVGGTMYCFTHDLKSIDTFMSYFSLGWFMRLHSADRGGGPVFLFILQKRLAKFPFLIEDGINGLELISNKISVENERRKGIFAEYPMLPGDLFELCGWRKVEPSQSVVFRLHFRFQDSIVDYHLDLNHHRHLITVHDIKESTSGSHVSVFLVCSDMQKHDIIKREEQRRLIEAIPPASCRLLVVCLAKSLEDKTKKEIMGCLDDLLKNLTPVECSFRDTWIRFLADSHIKPPKQTVVPPKKSSSSSPIPTASASPSPSAASPSPLQIASAAPSSSGAAPSAIDLPPRVASPPPSTASVQAPPLQLDPSILVSRRPYTLAEEETQTHYNVFSGCAVDGEHFGLDIKGCGIFRVEKTDITNSNLLVEMPYDMTLEEWLLSTPDRWLDKGWNEPKSRRENKTDSIPKWNAMRPTEGCTNVIQGILKAVVNLKLKGLIHGHLDDSANYLLSFDKEFSKGISRNVVNVQLVHRNIGGQIAMDMKSHQVEVDMMHVSNMVFDKILESVELPRTWQNLYDRINHFVDENLYEVIRVTNVEINYLMIIQDHICLWDWKDRVSLIDRFWSAMHWGDKTKDNFKRKVEWVLDTMQQKMKTGTPWAYAIPNDSPWRRYYDAQIYGPKSHQLLRYIRGLLLHYTEKNRDFTLMYFKLDEITDDSTNDEYAEVLICECFFPFVEDLHAFLELCPL